MLGRWLESLSVIPCTWEDKRFLHFDPPEPTQKEGGLPRGSARNAEVAKPRSEGSKFKREAIRFTEIRNCSWQTVCREMAAVTAIEKAFFGGGGGREHLLFALSFGGWSL